MLNPKEGEGEEWRGKKKIGRQKENPKINYFRSKVVTHTSYLVISCFQIITLLTMVISDTPPPHPPGTGYTNSPPRVKGGEKDRKKERKSWNKVTKKYRIFLQK